MSFRALGAWALQEQTAAEVWVLLPGGARDPTCPASGWRLADLRVATLRVQECGGWTIARVRQCLPR